MFLERYCYENMPDDPEDDDRDTIFAEFVIAWAKAHYGDEFDFDTCIIKKDVEPGIHTVTWATEELTSEEYGDLMRSFEPAVDEETYERITDKEGG